MTFSNLFNLLTEQPRGGFTSIIALLSWSVRLGLLLGAVLLACRVLRKQAAATKHRLLVIMLIGGGFLPLFAEWLPQLHVIPAPETPVLPPPQVTLPESAHPLPSSAAPLTPNVSVPSTPRKSRPFDWHHVLVMLWSLGAGLIVIRYVLGRILLARLRRHSLPASEEQLAALRETSQLHGIRRPIDLIVSDARTMPMTWGTFRPVILLPTAAHEWSSEKLTAVLVHETAHVKRHDALIHSFATLVTALHWFNPMVWLARRQMEHLREEACDDLVLTQGIKPSQYAEWLVDLTTQSRTNTAALAMAQPSRLTTRTKTILEPRKTSKPWVKWVVLAGFTTLAILLVIIAATIESEPRLGKEIRVTLSLQDGRNRVMFPSGKFDSNSHLEHSRYLQWRESWAPGVALFEQDGQLALKFQNVNWAPTTFQWNKVDLAFLEESLIERIASDPISRFSTMGLPATSRVLEDPDNKGIHYLEGGGKFQFLAQDVDKKTVTIRFQFRDPAAPPNGEIWPLLKDAEEVPQVTLYLPQELLASVQACAEVSSQSVGVRGIDSYMTPMRALARDASDLTVSPFLLDESLFSMLDWKPSSPPEPHAFCRMALAVVVHPNNPIASLTHEQLVNVTGQRGTTKSWNDLGIANLGEVMVLRQGGEISTVFGQFLGGSLAGFNLVNSRQAMIEATAGNRQALGHCLAVDLTNTVRAVPIAVGNELIPPSQATIADDRYPYAMTYYLYVSDRANPDSRAFAEWLLTSDAAAKSLQRNGFVAIR